MKSNFSFLQQEYPILYNTGISAEYNLHKDPVTSLFKIRQFSEKVTELLFNEHALAFPADDSFHNRLKTLQAENVLPWAIKDLFFLMKKKGNLAVHDSVGNYDDAKDALKALFNVAKWFYETYSDQTHNVFYQAFQEPENTNAELALQQLEQDYKALEIKLTNLLAEREISGLSQQQQQVIQQRSEKAARKIEMSEAETRTLIDNMLRKAGWEVDTDTINFKKHQSLPLKGKNRAIAEWPAGPLWADYALFIGTELYGFVEAKKYAQDISTDLQQAKVYAEKVQPVNDATLISTWGSYHVPFLFSTNGRPYLAQLKTKSGIWFLDARKPTNLPRPLQGWYSPEGLVKLSQQDIELANQKLTTTPLDFLESKAGLGLRKYQIKAIQAVENQLIKFPQERKSLLAMATGTGKTRTIIGLCYHLIQTNRFRRILFLTDRTMLSTQAINAFKDNKVVGLSTFADIYDLKGLKDLKLADDTRLHFATVQSMVKRLFYSDNDDATPAVDQYDCIIIDEAHRGYLLDKEIDEEDLSFKNQQDYVSKYRMVLDYFDAYAVGLTATPALHTTAIFGKPVYTYSYREAVIDGFLTDHDPPYLIKTQLGQEGIKWEKGEKPSVYDPENNTVVELDELDDELQIDIEGFNKRVLSESFNRTVLAELVKHLDPDGDEKTLIFAASDKHADDIVFLLKEEFANIGIDVINGSIEKITGASYNPQQLLTRYKNEKYPTIAVTVDLLTTGIDVPAICNIVFMRRVKSRILYEQMLGRATRRCDEIGKETFRIFDAVRLYETLEDYTQMKPVVVNPATTYLQLAQELTAIATPERAQQQLEQIIAKIQRSKRKMTAEQEQGFSLRAGGQSPDALVQSLRSQPVQDGLERVTKLEPLWTYLDEIKYLSAPVYVSNHEDTFLELGTGYGIASKPEDYLDKFTHYIQENQNRITALHIVCTRPAELDRRSLKELLIALATDGFEPKKIKAAWKQARNEDIGADIISAIRTLAIGSSLVSPETRIKKAVDTVRSMRTWNTVQLKWIGRFEKQLLAEMVLQVEDLDLSPFNDAGGFRQLNKIFENQLEQVILTINQNLYPLTA